jgi:hypothetical protein
MGRRHRTVRVDGASAAMLPDSRRSEFPLWVDIVEKVLLGGWSKFLEAAGGLIGKRAGGLPAKASSEWRASADPARWC